MTMRFRAALFICLLLLCGVAHAANDTVGYYTAASSGYKTATASYTFAIDCEGGYRYLVVGVSMLSVAGSSVTALTHDSVALTNLGTVASVSGAVRVEAWGLVAPNTGSKTISITLSAALDSAAGAICFTGVDATSPTEALNTATATNVGAADATVTVTTATANAWLVGITASDDTAITTGSGFTSRWNTTGTLGSGAGETKGPVASPGANTVNHSSVAALATWSIIGFALKPISGTITTYCNSVAIDHTKVPNTNQTNFPVYITFATDTRFKSTGNGGRVQTTDGLNLRYYTDFPPTSLMAYELDTGSYSASAGTFRHFTKVGTVDGGSNADTVFYLCYGNTGWTSDSSNAATTWSDYYAIFHFGDGTTLSLADSTGHGHTWTNANATAGTGLAGGSVALNGTTAKLTQTGFTVPQSEGAVTVALNAHTANNTHRPVWVARHPDTGAPDKGVYILPYSNNHVYSQFTNSGTCGSDDSVSLTQDTYEYLLWRYSVGSNAYTARKDGATGNTGACPSGGMWDSSAQTMYVGRAEFENAWCNCDIDELRFRTSAVTDDWFSAEANNLKSPSTFLTLGPDFFVVSTAADVPQRTVTGVGK